MQIFLTWNMLISFAPCLFAGIFTMRCGSLSKRPFVLANPAWWAENIRENVLEELAFARSTTFILHVYNLPELIRSFADLATISRAKPFASSPEIVRPADL